LSANNEYYVRDALLSVARVGSFAPVVATNLPDGSEPVHRETTTTPPAARMTPTTPPSVTTRTPARRVLGPPQDRDPVDSDFPECPSAGLGSFLSHGRLSICCAAAVVR
jgi:hypothetical protein